MNRLQLAHVLRAACRIGGDRTVLVLGSQAILGAHDEIIAARPKDRAFVTALIDHGLLDVDTLIERTLLVSDSEAIRRGRALAFFRG